MDAGEITRKRRDNILACNSDVYTAKRDTCTGCVDCEDGDSTLTVGYATGGFGNFWGYDNPGGLTTGNLVPNTIDGSGVRFMGFQTVGNFPNEFYVTLDTSGSSSFLKTFLTQLHLPIVRIKVSVHITHQLLVFPHKTTQVDWVRLHGDGMLLLQGIQFQMKLLIGQV